MTVTSYSFLMAVAWFTAFVAAGTVVQRLTGVVLCLRPLSLLCLMTLTVARLVLPLELPHTQVLRSNMVFPAVQDYLAAPTFGTGTITHAAFLLLAWGVGSVLMGIQLGCQLRRDRLTVAALPTAPAPGVQRHLDKLLRRRGKSRAVTLLVSPALTTPLLTGLLRPVILLPPEAAALPRQELEHILIHELTHLSNGDLWVKLLVRLLGCLMWWNPGVYLLRKDLDETLEYQCDLTATRDLSGEGQTQYLQTLLTVLRQGKAQQEEKVPEQALCTYFVDIFQEEVLKRRFHLVLDQRERPQRVHQAVFIAAVLVLFFFSYSFVLQPAYEVPQIEHAIEITPKTSYILAHADGTYSLICNGSILEVVTQEELDENPICYLEIVQEKRKLV